MTYPDPQMTSLLRRDFVCFSVNEADPGADGRALLRRHRLLWSPGFVFLEPRGTELRRFVGFRPPTTFLGELTLVLGLVDFLYQRFETAVGHFEEAARHFGDGEGAAEALYWSAIATYRAQGRDYDALKAGWEKIRERFPDSAWWSRTDVFDAEPTGRR